MIVRILLNDRPQQAGLNRIENRERLASAISHFFLQKENYLMDTIAAIFLEIARKAKSLICRPNLLAAEKIIPSATERRRKMQIADNRINDATTLSVRGGCAAIATFILLLGTASSWAQTDSRPSFGDRAISDQVWTADSAIEPLQLPEASDGDGELSYELTPQPPPGLSFNTASRTLSGTPTAAGRTTYTYTATDGDGEEDSRSFTIVIVEDLMPTLEEVMDRTWTQDSEILLPLPVAESGNGEVTYELTPEPPPGMTFEFRMVEPDPAHHIAMEKTWVLIGTPTVPMEGTEYTYSATDADGDMTLISFGITVIEDLMPEFVEDTGARTSVEGFPVELELPGAMGGNGELTYSLSPGLPGGLDFDAASRTISGTPEAPQALVEYTLTATDADADAADLVFSLMVEEDVNPEFTEEVQNQTWIQDSEIAVLDLPGAEGGNGPFAYSISPELPTGLTFWAGDQTILGTPTEVQERTIFVYRAVDADGDGVELTFSLEVVEDLMPTIAEGVGGQTWTEDFTVETLVLPEGSGGNGELTYELSPELAQGLVFDPETRTISGTPVVPKERTRYVYRAVDVDGDAAELTFSVMVLKDLMPSFPEAVQNQTWIQDSEIAPLDLPGAESGNGAISYSIIPDLPAGLTFQAGDQTVLGTPTEVRERTLYVYRAVDADGDAVEMTFSLVVLEDLMPSFAESVEAQIWTEDSLIEPLQLPAAGGGNGALFYSLSPELPAEMSFDAKTRTISGRPTDPHDETEYTLTATDGDGDPVGLAFSLTVRKDLMPSFSETVRNQTWTQDSAVELELPAAEGGNIELTGELRYTITPALPAGVTFDEGSLTISGTPENPQDLTRYVFRAIDADGDVVGLAFTVKVLEDLMPSFTESVEGQVWTQDSPVALALPVGEGGNGVDGVEGLLRYTLSPDLPDGLMFEGSRQRIRGTPTVPMGETTFTYTATDNDGDAVELTFSLTVLEDLTSSFSQEVKNQIWTQDSEVEPIVLPEAEDGNRELASMRYTVIPALPAGVTFDEGSLTISGTPENPQDLTRYVFRAIDADGDVVGLAFTVKVLEDLMPSFTESVEGQVWTQDSPVALALPVGEGGNGVDGVDGVEGLLRYTLSPDLPDGLMFEGSRQRIRGTPTVPMGETTFTYTATDNDGDAVELTFSLTVLEDLTSSFSQEVKNQIWTQDSEVEPIVLPEAEDGNRELASMRYTVIPALPAGVTFDEGSLTISGTPENPQDLTRYVFRAIDADGDVVGLAFTVKVLEDLMPSFTESVEGQVWTQDSPVALALPVGEGGNGVDGVEGLLRYTLSPDLPDGLMFEGSRQRIRGTPTVPMGETTFTYTATDNDGDAVELTFSLTVLEDLTSSFSQEVKNQIWTQDSEVEPIVLPEAEDGNRELASMRYTVIPALPAGVTFDEGSLTISGTPENPQDLTRYVFRAIDADGDVVGLAFTVKVLEDLMPSFTESVEGQVWTQDSPVALALPVGEGGNGVDGVEGLLRYTLSPDLPDGLMFEGSRQRIRGTPTVPMGETTFTYTATDNDGDAVELTFSLTVLEDLTSSFSQEVKNQIWTQDSEVEPIVLPEAEDGNRELASMRYTVIPALPAGVTFDEGSLTISGTPENPQDLTRYVFRAIDADGDVVGLAFTVKVLEDLMPSFTESVEGQVWTQDSPVALALPVGEGGNGVDGVEGLLRYTLSPDLPDGLMFEGSRQRIRGTPTVPMGETTFTYTATDNDGDAVELTFSLTVLEDLTSSFSQEVKNQIWTQDSEIEPIALPQASGGNVELTGELRYTLTPELPAGVTLNEGTISGTPTVAQELTRYVYRAIDADGDVAGVAFWVVVAQDLTPEFTESVEDRNYITDVAIAAWVLPKATSGNGLLVYTLTPDLPEGLSFDPPSRKITGTPTVAQDRKEYTYTATDADGDTGSLTFGLTITLAKPTALNLLPSLDLLAGGNAVSVNVDGLFSGQELAYQFESSDTEVASVQPDGASAEVTPKREGSAMVTVTATNSSGSADIQFSVTVSTAPEERAVLNDVLAGLARARLSSLTGVIGRRFEAGAASPMSASQASRYEARRGAQWFDLDAVLGGPGDSHRKPTSMLWGRTFAVALGSGESGKGGEWTGAMSDQSMSEPSSKMRWSLWGAGDQQAFSGGESNSYEGDLRSVYLGLDGEFGKSWLGGSRWLTGVSVASSSGEAEYDFSDSDMSGSGIFKTSLTSVYPYMRGALASGLELWSIAGVGSGEVTNERAHLGGTTDEGDLTMGLLMLGMRKPLTGMETRLTLLGDAAQEWLSANGTGSLSYSPVSSVQRARMGVELARQMASGLEPFGELSGRYDGGDGEAGSGVEVAAGSRYRSARLDIEARGRMLAMHSASGYKETGFGARIRVRSHADGTGMSMSLSPRWGRAEGSGALWRDQALQLKSGVAGASRLRAPTLGGGIGYGLAAARGVVTPVLEMDRNDYGRTRLRLALGYTPTPALMRALDMHGAMLDLCISRAEGHGSDPDHEIRMRGRLRL